MVPGAELSGLGIHLGCKLELWPSWKCSPYKFSTPGCADTVSAPQVLTYKRGVHLTRAVVGGPRAGCVQELLHGVRGACGTMTGCINKHLVCLFQEITVEVCGGNQTTT